MDDVLVERESEAGRQTGSETERQAGRETGGQADRQAGRQADMKV
jgi:hypothetical protein